MKASIPSHLDAVDLVIFDLFDTLLYRENITHTAFLQEMYGNRAPLRIAIEKTIRKLTIALTGREISKNPVGRIFISLTAQESVRDINRLFLNPVTSTLLRDARAAGKRCVIATNTTYKTTLLKERLSALGIDDIDIHTSGDYGKLKSQGLFLDVAKVENVDPSRILVIGDDLHEDIETSSSLGCKTLATSSYFDSLSSVISKEQIESLLRSESGRTYLGALSQAIGKSEIKSLWEYAGFLYSYPLARYITENLPLQSEEDFIFLSREGYFPHLLAERSSPKVSAHYLYVSRALLNDADGREFIKEQFSGLHLSRQRQSFFDIGWRGRSVDSVRNLLAPGSRAYFFALWPWHNRPAQSTTLVAGKLNLRELWVLRSAPEIFEFLLTAPHATMINREVASVGEESSEAQLIRGFKSAMSRDLPALTRRQLMKHFGLLTRKPTPEQAAFFGGIQHSVKGEIDRPLLENAIKLWIPGLRALNRISKKEVFLEYLRRIRSAVKQ